MDCDTLLANCQALVRVNQEIIARIQAIKPQPLQWVTSKLSLQTFPFSLETTPSLTPTQFLQQWRPALQLSPVEDLFNDKLSWAPETFEDIHRLNDQIAAVAPKLARLRGGEKELAQLRDNLERLQEALKALEARLSPTTKRLTDAPQRLQAINLLIQDLQRDLEQQGEWVHCLGDSVFSPDTFTAITHDLEAQSSPQPSQGKALRLLSITNHTTTCNFPHKSWLDPVVQADPQLLGITLRDASGALVYAAWGPKKWKAEPNTLTAPTWGCQGGTHYHSRRVPLSTGDFLIMTRRDGTDNGTLGNFDRGYSLRVHVDSTTIRLMAFSCTAHPIPSPEVGHWGGAQLPSAAEITFDAKGYPMERPNRPAWISVAMPGATLALWNLDAYLSD